MKRLLYVSIAFPPKNDPECLQTAKYFHYLQQLANLEIDVVSSALPTLFMPYDKNLEKFNTGFKYKIDVKIKENKYINYLRRKLFPAYFEKPDSKKSFHLSWRNTVEKIKEKPDIIYSRSFPLSSTVLALRLKEHYNVPWVLHLSDPWAFCPITKYKSREELEYHRNLERYCFEKADFVCLTSYKTIELYKNIYPDISTKFLYFPNVFNPADCVKNEFEFGTKIKIVYTGGLVEKRSVSYLIDALKILKEKAPEILEHFEFVFAGALDSYNKSFFEKSAFGNLKHLGLLPYNEALDLQRSADILLVIDNPIDNPDDAVFFPSKLLDYMLMQRNILAITTIGGTSDDLLKSIGAISVSHSDENGLVSALMDIHQAHSEKDKSFFFRDNIDERFSAEYNAKRLVQTFESLLK
jgi:glycosyltransferase involved in cell wall biosynthesis